MGRTTNLLTLINSIHKVYNMKFSINYRGICVIETAMTNFVRPLKLLLKKQSNNMEGDVILN
jgi:hypothetical protein